MNLSLDTSGENRRWQAPEDSIASGVAQGGNNNVTAVDGVPERDRTSNLLIRSQGNITYYWSYLKFL